MSICFTKNITNPGLYVRYRENNVWRSWTGITAEALTSGNKTINGTLTATDFNFIYNCCLC
jgi:hypothetical protein